MFLYEMLLAIVLAFIVIAILAPSRRYRAESGTPLLVFFFLLLFLLIWAAGAWLTPIGPPVMGIYWASFVIAAFFLLLLLFALASPPDTPRRGSAIEPGEPGDDAMVGTIVAFSIFFWALLIGAIIALVFRYS
ncbi:MAG: hypothetical protein RQ826_03295 [Xanthomonadales bacterium]|nr:hypothetical protein [Xanthomonadales bacterium]